MTGVCDRCGGATGPSEAVHRLDSLLGDITKRRVALERSLALAAATLYPELWREITFLRGRVSTLTHEKDELTGQNAWLASENARLRNENTEGVPTEPLQRVPDAPGPAETRTTHRRRLRKRP